MTEFFKKLFDLLFRLWPIRYVRSYQQGVRFTSGEISETKAPGWYLLIPLVQEFETECTLEDTLDLGIQSLTTKDWISVSLECCITFRISAAAKLWSKATDHEQNIRRSAASHVSDRIEKWTYDELLDHRAELKRSIRETLANKFEPWGIEITAVGILSFTGAKAYRLLGSVL